jgi:hypothetical protein
VVETDPRIEQDHVAGQLPCPPNPPPPVGWKYWNHSVRASLVELATRLLHDAKTYPMGSFVQTWMDGELVAARVEWHDFQGASGKRGCFRGVNLMQRDSAAVPLSA